MTDLPRDWQDPRWDEGSMVHNWRNHVPERVAEIWASFTDEQKQELARWADALADKEHWD